MMRKRSGLLSLERRSVCAGLMASALVGSRSVMAQTTKTLPAELDTDEGGYPLDDVARDHLRWWTTPANVIRAYLGGTGQQHHIRLAQPDRPGQSPVILLHNTGQSGRVWDHVLPRLGEDRSVIAPDLPAHGDSDGDPLTSTSSHAAAVVRLADALGLHHFDIIGDGLGAHVAITVAAMVPVRIGRLVLSGAGVEALATPLRPNASDPEKADFLLDRWQRFTRGYSDNAPIGLVDRDFADLMRARSVAPWDNGAFGLASGVQSPTLVLASSDRGKDKALKDSLPNGTLNSDVTWKTGDVSINAAKWVETIKNFLDRDRRNTEPSMVSLPDEVLPKGAIVRRFMTTPGGQMHYRVIAGEEEGPPLLCFHMSPRTSAYYEPLMAALSLTRRTIMAVDTAGYGETFKPPAWLNVPGYANHMGNFIDALGIDEVDLMGDHTGSKIAVETSRQRPDKVRRLVMNTAGVYSLEEQRGWQNRMGAIPVSSDGNHYAALWERFHTLNRGKLDADQNAFRFYETVRAGPCMWWGSRAANLYILGEILPEIEHKILLVCSDEDSLIEPSRRGAKLLRNGRYVEFPGLGNSMVEYRAAAIAPTIASFLSEA